jgi:CheY-like chemotaxis protein
MEGAYAPRARFPKRPERNGGQARRKLDFGGLGRSVGVDIAGTSEARMGQRAGGVVVIDDDDDWRDVVMAFLGEHGFATVGFSNGRDALLALRGREAMPAVILLDLEMPLMTGWEFRREQLRDPRLARIPVVIASSADPGSLVADARLEKPFETAELCRVIAELALRPMAA